MNSTAVKPPVAPTKLCHLIKRPDFEGYGFNLHSEKIKPGQFIGKIDVNSPAEAAGLKKGDRIIEVNGVPINNETHKQVVQRIKAIENEVRLLLIDVDGVVNGSKINEDTMKATTNHINKINEVQVDQEEDQEVEKDVVDNNKTNINKTINSNSNMITESMQSNLNSSSQISKDTNQQIQTTTTTAAAASTTNLHNNNNNNENNNNSSQNEMPLNNNNNNNISNKTINGNHSSKTTTNTLQLPLTAAEMRAKLMSKKKYDPKSESVDIKKKFQIIQTL